MAVNWLQLARTPQAYHGRGRRRGFFEGWYVKLVDQRRDARLALIPGIFRAEDPAGPHESFIQVLDGRSGASAYHRFPTQDFHASQTAFAVDVAGNRFDDAGLRVDLPATPGIPALRGEISYTEALTGWPVTWKSPGAMGWYGWLPFLECYHGVVSFGHGLSGQIGPMDFAGGRGYIEKDWGQAFPQAHIWVASNHFRDPEMSLMGSIAIIPWRGSAFRGFLVGLAGPQGLRTFATHTGARTEHLSVGPDHVSWTLVSRTGERLELQCDRPRGGLLAAPVRSQMHHRVEETLDGVVSVRLWSPDRRLLVDDVGSTAGLEVHGDLTRLLAMA